MWQSLLAAQKNATVSKAVVDKINGLLPEFDKIIQLDPIDGEFDLSCLKESLKKLAGSRSDLAALDKAGAKEPACQLRSVMEQLAKWGESLQAKTGLSFTARLEILEKWAGTQLEFAADSSSSFLASNFTLSLPELPESVDHVFLLQCYLLGK